jgi:hypothetical protein
MARYWLLLIACALGCSAASRRDRGPGSADGSTLRPATLEYAGRHEGDHPTWRYRQTVTISMAEREGRPVWRRAQAFRDDDKVASTIEADRQTLQPVRSELMWNGVSVRLDYAPGRLSGVIEEKNVPRAVDHRHPEQVVLSDLLDLQIAALPLEKKYQTKISLLDFWLLDQPPRVQTRLFVIRVEREDLVRVPAGEIPVYVVAIEPTDGDDRLKATYHVLKTRPHYPVRMEYIVNPATVGEEKRSVGIDELVSLSVQRIVAQ